MIIIFGIIIITTILIITTVTIINQAMFTPSQPSMQFADDLEPRLEKKDEMRNKGVKNLILYYSNLEYQTVFNILNAKMVGRNDIVFCAGPC